MGDPSKRRLAPLPRLLHWIGTNAARLAGLTGRFVVAWVRRSGAPMARRGGAAVLRGAGLGLAGLGRLAWQRRVILAGLLLRGAWWGSLWLTLAAVLPLLGAAPLDERDAMLMPLVYALMLVAIVVMLSPERHLRRFAIGLGAVQASLVALVWAAFAVSS